MREPNKRRSRLRLPRRFRIGRDGRRMAREEVEPIPGKRGAGAAPRQVEGRTRPITIALPQERQIEQPFTGIVEDLEAEYGVAADTADETARREAQR